MRLERPIKFLDASIDTGQNFVIGLNQMRYANRRRTTPKGYKTYVPPTPEQIAERNRRIDAYNASLPKPVPFLTPEDPDAFLNMTKKDLPEIEFPSLAKEGCTAECPKCHGFGGWHLRVNAYPKYEGDKLVGYNHFDAHCGQCNGWGYVKPGRDTECVHDWVEVGAKEASELGVAHYGNCYHVYKCGKGCGATCAHDSSD
jgi:hypothetical protein